MYSINTFYSIINGKMELPRCPSPETIADHLTNAIRSKLALDHVCHFNKCTIVNLTIEIHRNKATKQYGIKCRYMKSVDWIVDSSTLIERIYSLYICKNTGKIHHCHPNCDGDGIA